VTEEVRFILSADDSKSTAALKRTEDGIKRVGSATAYTKQQMQQLSFQLTDIVSGLTTGQSPFYVLMQQGGQLRDTFGGVGGAVRALSSVFTVGRVVALGMAGGIAAFASAAFEGWQQSNRLRDSIALTGNAAGMTEDRFNALTRSIADSSTATIGSAREITQALVSTGRFGGAAIDSAARAATLLQRATGNAAEDIVRDFARMSQGVAKWAQETNERYHFLDAATFKLIQKQEKLGNTQEAMRIAFEAFAKPLQQQQENLGALERAWNAVGKAASEAWDSMLSVGRAETIDQQIAKVQKLIEANARRTDLADSIGPNGPRKGASARSAELQLELAGLMRQRRGQMGAADLAALVAAQEQRAIEAAAKTPKTFDQLYPPANVAGIIGSASEASRLRQNEAGGYGSTDAFLRDQAQREYDALAGPSALDAMEEGFADRLALWQEHNEEMLDLSRPQWQKLAEAWENTTLQMQLAGDRFADGFVDAGRGAFEEFMRTGKLSADGFKNLFLQTLTELVYDRLIAKQMGLLANTLWNYLANGMVGGGWGFGSGTADPSVGPPAELAGQRAAGGPVFAGRTYLVGERGPELLRMGGRGGHVVPNAGMGGVTIYQTINAGQGVGYAEVYRAATMAKDAAVAEIEQRILRGNRVYSS
jgi:phage-related minor tail protein